MTNRSQRAIVAMTVLVTALCAEQLMIADGAMRPQVAVGVADRVAGRLLSVLRTQAPLLARRPEPAVRFVSLNAVAQQPDGPSGPHPAELPVQMFRLPPPSLL